jgi:hypothetical protein
MKDIGFMMKDYQASNGQTTSELSLHMCSDTGGQHCPGAVPVIDILKYALLQHPDLVARAHAELSSGAANDARRATLAENAEAFCEAFLAQFPTKKESSPLACDSSDTWMRVIDGYPTSGEGCVIKGLSLVDYYTGREPTYLFHTLKSVSDWADTQGWRAELYDAGTVKFYPER